MGISLAQIVCSKAGRDSGRNFIVVGIIDSTFLLMADGKLRRLEKPKKKRIKHVHFTEHVVGFIKEKLENELKVTNAEIRKALAMVELKQEGIDDEKVSATFDDI